ncbi:MAG: chromosome segregation protein SMC [Parachlamydiaceae bacterium]
MKLKQLEILGFKSFADKTVVRFHEGITAIVGPNGCGKSNIGDAIQWVLGEQSIKALRGGKMPDVIFSGTATRKAQAFSEVTITFSEIGGKLPVPYDEIEITRRLFRNGDSEYLINKQIVRYKDIQSLFFDSGIGKRNFSTFQQREIDDIIQRPPKERREVFEEAAEIKRFLHTRKETLRRFEEVDSNVKRLTDIQKEVLSRVATLKQQREEAQAFQEGKTKLEKLERSILRSRYEGHSKKRSELQAKESAELAEAEKWKEEAELLSKECERLKASLEKTEAAYVEVREACLTMKGEKELKEHVKQESSKKKQNLSKEIEEKKGEIALLEKEQTVRQQESEKDQKECERLRAGKEQAAEKMEQAKALFTELDNELNALRGKQAKMQEIRLEASRKEAMVHSEKERQAERLKNFQERKVQFEERVKQLSGFLKNKGLEHEQKKKQLQEKQQKHRESADELHGLDVERGQVNSAIEKETAQSLELQKALGALQTKRSVLQQLQEEGEGLSAGGKKLLQDSKNPKSPLYGLIKPLYEWIIPGRESAQKLQLVLSRYSDTLTVADERDLLLVLEAADSLGVKEFSILCLADIKATTPEAVMHHFFHSIVHADSPKSSHGDEVWHEEGWLLDRRKVRFYGNEEKASSFTRHEEIHALQGKIEGAEKEAKASRDKVRALQEEKNRLAEALKIKDQATRALEKEAMEAEFQEKRLAQELGKLELEVKQVNEEIEGVASQLESVEKRQKELEQELLLAKKATEEAFSSFNALQESSSEKGAQYHKLKEALDQASAYYRSMEEEFRKAAHANGLLSVKIQESERLKERLYKELKKHQEDFATVQTNVNDEEAVQKLALLLEAHSRQAEDLKQEQGRSKEVLHEREEKRHKAYAALKQAENKLQQISIQKAHAEAAIESGERELKDRFQIDFDEIEILPAPLDQQEREAKKWRNFLESAPPVNMAAIDEYKEQEERGAYLTNQLDDLSGSKAELLALIQKVEGDCRKAFQDTFLLIRSHFQKNFQALFHGGQADLELTAGDDLLEAGIEISAKPPGKEMRSLSLLSGGEKCLTAMALLFAIFEVKSSPFCLLDEIDAPLDDSNVERFVNMVKNYTDRSQFIIVTHNKRTMAIADRLYGVSMQEKGVSKLLSMEFSKEVEESVLVHN